MRTILLFLIASCGSLSAGFARSGPVPLFFTANRGQSPESARFTAQAPGLTAFFYPGQVLFRSGGAELRMRFPGSRAAPPEAGKRLPGEVNFLFGAREQWLKGEALYNGVVYRDLYPGIEMRFSSEGGNFKSEFVVAPGADPARIRVHYSGGGELRIDENGALAIPLGGEEFREQPPAVYQERGGRRIPIEGRFALDDGVVTFVLGEYDAFRPLIIDPAISYSTLLGGSGADLANAIAVDSTGAAYIAGFTESSNLPNASPAQSFNAGGNDIFIAKLDPAGNNLVYCTYIGGAGDDRAYGIAVDAAGAVYVTGSTTSQNFPVRNPLQSRLAGNRNAFVLKLAPAGNSLAYSAYLGGNSSDAGNGIAVDAGGYAYVVGDTTSLNFPASNWQRGNHGVQDAFIVKVSTDGSRLIYSTYLGGSNTDHGASIAVDADGKAWVAGSTWSTDFPTARAFQTALAGGQDAFLACLAADGNALLFGSFLGGSGGTVAYPEGAQALALDPQGNAYVAGVTSSGDFPLLNPLQSSRRGMIDAFVAKINASNSLSYSTYLGGSSVEVANAIAVDASGNAYVAGYTYSTDLSVTPNALQGSNAGDCDTFLAEITSAGALGYLSYLGGTGADTATAVVASRTGPVYLAGWTLSSNFPLLNPFQLFDANDYGVFVTKLKFGAPPTITGMTPSSGGGSSQTFSFQFSDSDGATDLTGVAVIFNSSSTPVNGCAVLLDPVRNSLSLLTDAGLLGGSIAPGSGSQQNNSCILSGAGSSFSRVGTLLTLKLALTFRSSMTGQRNVYMQAADSSAATDWQMKGTWLIPGLMTSPANASTLPGATVTFRWSSSGDFPEYWLTLRDPASTWFYNGSAGSSTSITLTNVPVNGHAIIARLWSRAGDSWLTVDYAYMAAGVPAGMTASPDSVATISPEPGSVLPGSSVTFQWAAAAGVSEYWLYASRVAPGGKDIYNSSLGLKSNVTLTNLPTNGGAIYVRLWSKVGGSWMTADYAYMAAGVPAGPDSVATISPEPGSVLPGSTVTFQWAAAAGVSEYWLYASKVAPGGKDIYNSSLRLKSNVTLTNLPTNGGPIYVRLWSKTAGTWSYTDFIYTAAHGI